MPEFLNYLLSLHQRLFLHVVNKVKRVMIFRIFLGTSTRKSVEYSHSLPAMFTSTLAFVCYTVFLNPGSRSGRISQHRMLHPGVLQSCCDGGLYSLEMLLGQTHRILGVTVTMDIIIVCVLSNQTTLLVPRRSVYKVP